MMHPQDLRDKLERFWQISGRKIELIDNTYDWSQGSPVFTQAGRYTSRGWTEWTEGFVYGSAVLQFDATGESKFLEMARGYTVDRMAKHVTHMGVHDHGFNNVSTYGNLLRLMKEGKLENNEWERKFYELALKCSGAVQAARWTELPDGDGFIHSFNGPHSLFADTIRSCRSLALAHSMGHVLMGESDYVVSLLGRLVKHMIVTSRSIVYFGEGRDTYDIPGRVAHEAIFNIRNGSFRCPSTQQGYSPFSTWTRGLAWIVTGFAELIEYFELLDQEELAPYGGKGDLLDLAVRTARVTADFYLAYSASDNIPYWDTGAPGLAKMGDYLSKPADPFNDYEPVDSSAAAIAAQGLLRLGRHLGGFDIGTHIENDRGGVSGVAVPGGGITRRKVSSPAGADADEGKRYFQAGIGIVNTLLSEPYLAAQDQSRTEHQGLLLHSIYHRPRGWDYIPEGGEIPFGESSMWGDYHLREVALYVQRLVDGGEYYHFWP